MRILVISSGNVESFDFEKHHAFIYDQIRVISLQFPEVQFENYFVKGKGTFGYLSNVSKIKKAVNEIRPDLIHAHGGHIGFLCLFQRKIPVVTTFHGSDINFIKTRLISALSSLFSSYSIFVSEKLRSLALYKGRKNAVIPCGVDLDRFMPMSRNEAKSRLKFPEDFRYILFSSQFENPVKNFRLAEQAIKGIPDVKIVEIKNRNREEVKFLLNGAELLIMTSFKEGSPQVIKEAMACNCPIVSVNVGDVQEILAGTEGVYLCKNHSPEEVKLKVIEALSFSGRTNGRKNIERYDNKIIAQRVFSIYKELYTKKL